MFRLVLYSYRSASLSFFSFYTFFILHLWPLILHPGIPYRSWIPMYSITWNTSLLEKKNFNLSPQHIYKILPFSNQSPVFCLALLSHVSSNSLSQLIFIHNFHIYFRHASMLSNHMSLQTFSRRQYSFAIFTLKLRNSSMLSTHIPSQLHLEIFLISTLATLKLRTIQIIYSFILNLPMNPILQNSLKNPYIFPWNPSKILWILSQSPRILPNPLNLLNS